MRLGLGLDMTARGGAGGSGSPWTEQITQGNGSGRLYTASGAIPNSAQVTIYARGTGIDSARSCLIDYRNNNQGGIYAPYSITSGFTGPYGRQFRTDTNATITGHAFLDADDQIAVSPETTFDAIYSLDVSGGSGSVVSSFAWSDDNGATWTTGEVTNGTFSGGTLVGLNSGSWGVLGQGSTSTATSVHTGKVSRVACWTGVYADCTDPAIQALFADGSGMVDPATAQTALSAGTLQFDFYTLDMFNLDETPDGARYG